MNQKQKRYTADMLWDLWCCCSLIGIWPRYIEPNLLVTTPLKLRIAGLPPVLSGFKILQFSDLHFNSKLSSAFLTRLKKTIDQAHPNIIVFTGDFLCASTLQDAGRLHHFLCSLKASHGCYAILGNHDYAKFVSINKCGEYDLIDVSASAISKGFKRLFSNISLKGIVNPRAKGIPPHSHLVDLLSATPFKLLHNKTEVIPIENTYLNLCGVGEYTLGQCQPQEAFAQYDRRYPGIILSHNPDSIPLLRQYPGEVILCGHTHGAQINLPFIWKKFTRMENPQFKRGLMHEGHRHIYINRGVGAVMPFRWFSIPEVLSLTLEAS